MVPADGLRAPTLDTAALDRWLVSPAVVAPSGAVASWDGPDAFAYPEAGGLLLRRLDGAVPADAIARWLARCVDEDAVGRAGVRYTFDLGVVLAGLLAHPRRAAIDGAIDRGLERLARRVHDAIAIDGAAPSRWSTRFGPHLRKLETVLALAESRLGPAATARLRERLWVGTGGDGFDPRAPTPGADATYLHACLYALEGTLLAARGHATRIDDAACWLVTLQRPDGAMPAWADRDRGFGPARADATAQAVRWWAWIDRRRFAVPIARGLGWLARAVAPRGGVRYGEDRDHANTWATMFAIQAAAFTEGGVDPRGVL